MLGRGQKIELDVSSNVYIHEVCSLITELKEWSKSDDYLLSDMANMKKHFDKYWRKMEKVNQLLLIAIVLDPRHKLEYADFSFGDIYEDNEVACKSDCRRWKIYYLSTS